MSNLIQELLAEGVIKLWHDYRSGHCNDLSPNGNDGTINGNCDWEGYGLRFVDNTAYVQVAHHASLNLTDATMVLLKPKMRSAKVSSGVGSAFWIDKSLGGAGTLWRAYLGANRLYFSDGVVARSTGLAYYDDERYVALSAPNGGTAIGYREGLSIGNFSGVNNLSTNTHNVRIGAVGVNYYDGTIQSIMIINRVLTATEHAQLYDELANLTWPTGLRGFAKRSQLVERADSKLISGWNLKPVGGQVPDEITTRDLTTINRMVSKPGILGPGMSGPVEGYLATAINPYVNADFSTNGISVECWLRPAALLAGNNYLFDYAGRIRMRQNGVAILWEVYDSAAAFQIASGPLRVNELRHIIGTAKANGDIKLYLDGELQAVTDTMLNFNIFAGRPTVWGAEWDFTSGVDADFFKPRIYDYELSQAEVSAKYLEGAQAVQFSTDWGFKQSVAAEGGTIHQELGGPGSPLQAGDAVFRGVIETATINGRLNKVLRCTVAGKVYTNAARWFDCTSVEAGFGTFSGWMYKTNASTLTWKFIGTDLNAAANGYAIVWAADESVVISELGVGNVVAGGTASHSTWHKFDQTRASDGDFDGYINDTTYGNGNDLTITTSIGMLWSMGVGDMISLGGVQGSDGQVKKLGVDPP